jgi:hypothetical protein
MKCAGCKRLTIQTCDECKKVPFCQDCKNEHEACPSCIEAGYDDDDYDDDADDDDDDDDGADDTDSDDDDDDDDDDSTGRKD